MNPTTFPIILIGNSLVVLLLQFGLARFIVTGTDQRKLTDLPRIKWYLYGVVISAITLAIGMVMLQLPPSSFDLAAFSLIMLVGVTVMLLEKKHLPNTGRHLLTLCSIGCTGVVCGIYGWATYL